MFQKLAIASAAAILATVGVAGVAYAGDAPASHHDKDHKSHHKSDHKSHHKGDSADTNCSSEESTEQVNKGKQLVGGNLIVRGINGLIGGSIEKGAICPSLLNNNSLGDD